MKVLILDLRVTQRVKVYRNRDQLCSLSPSPYTSPGLTSHHSYFTPFHFIYLFKCYIVVTLGYCHVPNYLL